MARFRFARDSSLVKTRSQLWNRKQSGGFSFRQVFAGYVQIPVTAAIADDGARWMRDRLHAPHVLPMYVPMQEISRVQPVEQHVEALKSAMTL